MVRDRTSLARAASRSLSPIIERSVHIENTVEVEEYDAH
jgi:hypothetical protein